MTTITAREAITSAAQINGWNVTETQIDYVTIKRGRRYIDVGFSTTGGITYVSHAKGRVFVDMRAFVLEFLAR